MLSQVACRCFLRLPTVLNATACRCWRRLCQICLRVRRCSSSACRGELLGALLPLLSCERSQVCNHSWTFSPSFVAAKVASSSTAMTCFCYLAQELQARWCCW